MLSTRKSHPTGRALAVTLAILLSACVPKSKYDQAITDAQKQAQLDHARISSLDGKLQTALAESRKRDEQLSLLGTSAHNLQARLDDATAINQHLRDELTRLGKDVDKILKEKGTLSDALDSAKARLEELRKAQEAAERRVALFKQLVEKFQKMIDAGSLKIVMRDGRMVLELPNDVLFDSGKVDLKQPGRETLTQVGKALSGIDRRFQVAGHTDDVPISTVRFPSNWELSTARAVEVVRFLVAAGVKPEMLSAAGYGSFDPLVANDSPDRRAKNRRIEITLQPNLEELVGVPAAPAPGSSAKPAVSAPAPSASSAPPKP